jgi:hypothetical protein
MNLNLKHPVMVLLGLIVTAFLAGIAAYRGIGQIAREAVTSPDRTTVSVEANAATVPSPSAAGAAAGARYPFESGTMGWLAQDHPDVRGCSRVSVARTRGRSGSSALEMSLRIRGADPSLQRGEAWVEIAGPAPSRRASPQDLSERTLTLWVYAPRGTRGPHNRRNGVQLFAKDSEWRSLYGPWNNIDMEDEWFSVDLPLDGSTAAHLDAGYDPTRIAGVGLKFAAGDGSRATYDGPIYIDDVDW